MHDRQLALDESLAGPPDTEGVAYIGSKRELIPYILEAIQPLDVTTVFDGFSGTTRVAQALAQSGYNVIASDVAVWSEIFGRCYLLNDRPPSHYRPLVSHLNNLEGADGWFTEHYGGHPNEGESTQSDGKKKPWQIHNTRKLDAIRPEIERIADDPIEKAVLLTSLLLALDKVDNTIGHHTSYLREWSKRSYNDLHLEVPRLLPNTSGTHQVYRGDIFDVLPKVEADFAYYDPPYGSSNEKMPPSRVRYASYYHLWKTVCLNDRPEIEGAANRRIDVSDTQAASVFEDYRKTESGRYRVVAAIEKLLDQTNADYILLSYSNKGRATREQLTNLLDQLGFERRVFTIDYSDNVMSTMRWTDEWTKEINKKTVEYLFLMSRNCPLPEPTTWSDR